MMSYFARLFLATFLLSLFFVPNFAMAEGIKIAVVDVDKVLNDSKAGESIQKQLSVRRENFQKEFAGHENNLMKTEKALLKKKKNSSAEEFAKARKDFEKQILETKNLFQKRRNSLDKGLAKALSKLRKSIIQVTAEIADEDKYQVVLTRDSVVIIEKGMDITAKVLKRLNKKTPDIKLDTVK